jgi:mRNA interferase RelE/StbE
MSRYTVYVVPGAWREMKDLPGKVSHRVKQAVDRLADDPRPARSSQLDAPDLEPTLYRLRLDRWRIVYAISEEERTVDVLAVRKRPPYDYGDLADLGAEVE